MKSVRFLRYAAGVCGKENGTTSFAADTAASSFSSSSTGGTTASPSTPGSSTAPSVHSALHAFRTRDITLRIPSRDHFLRISFCSTSYLLAETIRRHNLLHLTGASIPFLQLLGTQLTFTNLLASAQEGEERVETRFTVEEATILTEALALGECRCYLRPDYNAQLEARGQPTFPLRVSRILYRQRAPFSSVGHADLAELLQPPTTTTITAGTPKDDEEATLDHAVPLSLHTPTMASRVPRDAWTNFFSYNSTLHAYNYLRRSDGCVPAVWMHAAINAEVLRADGLLDADGAPTSKNRAKADVQNLSSKGAEKAEKAEAQALQRTLLHAISHSFGVIITPLAAGENVERRVGHLNRVLTEAAAVLHAPPNSAETASPIQPLLDHCKETYTTCQHVLSLLTGDYEGAHASAVAARQYSEDPAQVAKVVDPIRRVMGVADFVIPLAATEASRVGIDFFCRCSKQNIMSSLVAAPASALTSLQENQGIMNCSFCGKHYQLGVEDWAELEKSRVARPASPSK